MYILIVVGLIILIPLVVTGVPDVFEQSGGRELTPNTLSNRREQCWTREPEVIWTNWLYFTDDQTRHLLVSKSGPSAKRNLLDMVQIGA